MDHKQSYVFVANHQGPMDIFLIYGFLGRNFKWMMKKALRRVFMVGYACEKAGHIFVDKSGPKKIQETIDLTMTLEELMNRLSAIQGVLKADVLAG